MKKFISTIIFVFAVTASFCRGGFHHSIHHSSHHSSGHTSHHTTTHHISHGQSSHTTNKTKVRSYNRITHVSDNEIHSYSNGGQFLYYYLIFNNNTHTNDTIKSHSKEDLKTQILEISDVDDSESNSIIWIIMVVAVILGCAVLFFYVH